jgi:hypothetical protein
MSANQSIPSRGDALAVVEQIKAQLEQLGMSDKCYVAPMPDVQGYKVIVRFKFAADLKRAGLSTYVGGIFVDIKTDISLNLRVRGRMRPVDTLPSL